MGSLISLNFNDVFVYDSLLQVWLCGIITDMIFMKGNFRSLVSNDMFIACIFAVVYLCMQLPFLDSVRPVMYDEAWYSSTGYNFSIGKGFVNTIVGSGGNTNIVLPFMVGISFYVFGVSLFAARLVAVACGMITLFFIARINKELHVSVIAKYISLLLFCSLTIFNTIFRFARPECASIMFCVIGVFFFIRILSKSQKMLSNYIGLSAATFFALLSHPFSVLLFAIFGCYLLIKAINTREYIHFLYLSVLLLSALLGIASLVIFSYYFIEGSDSILSRTILYASSDTIKSALLVYFKSVLFSKHIIYSWFMCAILIIASLFGNHKGVRACSVCTLIFTMLFPFVFTTDLNMVGLGLDYFMAMGIIVFAHVFDIVYLYFNKNKFCIYGILTYCLMNFVLTIAYNVSKYSDDNRALYSDIQDLIPKQAKCFGSIRQWFLVPESDFISDHYRGEIKEDSFDYLIINSVDEANPAYTNYEYFVDKSGFSIIYSKNTKQYGIVSVYKKTLFLK